MVGTGRVTDTSRDSVAVVPFVPTSPLTTHTVSSPPKTHVLKLCEPCRTLRRRSGGELQIVTLLPQISALWGRMTDLILFYSNQAVIPRLYWLTSMSADIQRYSRVINGAVPTHTKFNHLYDSTLQTGAKGG